MDHKEQFLADNPTCVLCGSPSAGVALIDDRNLDLDARRYKLVAMCQDHHRDWAIALSAETN